MCFLTTLTTDEVAKEYEQARELFQLRFLSKEEYLRRIQQLNDQLDVAGSKNETGSVEKEVSVKITKRKREVEPDAPRPRRCPSPHPTVNLTKHWVGVSLDSPPFRAAVSLVGGYCPDPHFSLGWCQLSDELQEFFLQSQYQNSLKDLQGICESIQSSCSFLPVGFELLGQKKNRISVIYSARGKSVCSTPVDLEIFNQDILEIWRRVARDFASKNHLKFATVDAGGIEKGFIGGTLAYQMRAIPLKMHLTIGSLHQVSKSLLKALDSPHLLSTHLANFPPMVIRATKAYISMGKTSS